MTFTSCHSNSKKSNEKAPLFDAQASQNGNEFNYSLKDALSKGNVVLYFFPSAYTGGCDLEAKTFSDHINQFTSAGTTVIGVSADDIDRLNTFSADPEFCGGKFPIASDPDGKIAALYGLTMAPAQSDAKDVRGIAINHGFIPRTTFVINKDGEIVKVFSSEKSKITPDEHVIKSLELVQNL